MDLTYAKTIYLYNNTLLNSTLQIYAKKIDLNMNYITAHHRLIEELLNPTYYEKNVHPRRNFSEPIHVNLSMSLYQVLEVVSLFYKLFLCF